MHHWLHTFSFIEVGASKKDESAKSFSTFRDFIRANFSRVSFNRWSKEAGEFVSITFICWSSKSICGCYPPRTHNQSYIVGCDPSSFCDFGGSLRCRC
jgi:hypothetical protein